MPANDSLRLYKNQRRLPAWPEPAQENPKELVGRSEPRVGMPSLEHGDLLAQSHILKQQIVARGYCPDEQSEEQSRQSEHATVLTRYPMCKSSLK
jgi:hypothetical protein